MERELPRERHGPETVKNAAGALQQAPFPRVGSTKTCYASLAIASDDRERTWRQATYLFL